MATLGQLGNFINGRGFKRAEWGDQGLPIIRIQNLTGSGTRFNRYPGNLEEEHRVRPGDLLISWSATLDAFIWNGPEGALNQHIYKVEPFMDKVYLFYCIKTFLRKLVQQVHGTGMQHITKTRFMNTMVPVAPLPEQKRIVAKVESLLAESKTAREALNKVPVLLRKFHQSVLAKAFRGGLTQRNPRDEPVQKLLERIRREQSKRKLVHAHVTIKKEEEKMQRDMLELPEEWNWTNLGALVFDARYGTSKKCFTESKGIPVLRIPNVVNGVLDFSDIKYTELTPGEIERLSVNLGDILVVRTNGSLNLVGKSSVVDKLQGKFVFASYLIRLRPVLTEILPEYLNLILSSQIGRDVIEEKARSTAGQFNVNLQTLLSVPVPLAPLEEIKRVVDKIKEYFSLADGIEVAVRKARERVDFIDQAVLAKAFRGELVPQDPNDEPTSMLLQRINASR
jgi:type I restriction enzyme S subunit